MLRFLQVKDLEKVKEAQKMASETGKQDKTGTKGTRAALKALDSPKPSPKPEKAEKIKEPKIDGASVGGKSSDTDFDKFKTDIQKMFTTLDGKMAVRIEELDKKFTGMFEKFGKELASLRSEVAESKTSIDNVSKKVDEIEISLEFQSKRLSDSKEKQTADLEKAKSDMDKKIEELNQKQLLMEKQDRKYNLIFYGFPEERNENVVEKLKLIFIKDLSIDPFRVERMQFNHGHRMPSEATGAPKPIILRFSSYADRDLVLSCAYKLAGSRRRIVTDLPVMMKKERNRLAKEAYEIRKGELLQTRIREKGLSVYLQVRKDENVSWARREVPVVD